MTISVKFFASIRERLGRTEADVDAATVRSAADVWARVTDQPMPSNTLVAINQEYAAPDQPVRDGDEVAFFPPVTGGDR
jgi:molybdopterin synthase sulfur carrier subunit